MKYDPAIHHRRSIRLQEYDYSRSGAFFVTVCTQNRECLFGDIVNEDMRLNDAGRIVADSWLKTAEIRDEIKLDEWVVMPNHFHGIVVITDGRGDRRVAPTGPQSRSVGAVMAGSNPPSPNASTNYAKHPAQNCGNAIIGNTSSAMNRN